ncbi:hypothetical protein EPUS_03286 [Endocarpon pusillum Z07020]|uniref:Cell surface spherulin 4-like protein n=1 Tax=Endocarpon pusillum (strain Z07020 / HMAS-L-300199) TaxID=1263415 RepID=U1G197_ENDPU|nr:uncharacterized protein EPUS_03286 [Endocarpon pusillum Z07020]ERF71007.1 hypothetical protein EPUS_03286 [Endocarpon pusillum Z07020]
MGAGISCFKGNAVSRRKIDSTDSEDDKFDPRIKEYNPYVCEIATMGDAPKSTILLPLYVYPNPGAWTPLQHMIAAYPNVSFTVVINPFNGPGLDDLPDANYQREIPRLTCHANVKVVGYVHTTWAKRDLALVFKDIDKYAQWPECSGLPDLKISGVFVDETPNVYDAEAEAYLAKLWKHVKKMPAGDENVVIHNPGCVPDAAFLKLADSTVVFEDTYHTFQTRVSNAIFSATALSMVDRSKLACVIHSIPEHLNGEEWRRLGQQARKIAGDVFMTELCEHYYANFAPKWVEFVDAMAA